MIDADIFEHGHTLSRTDQESFRMLVEELDSDSQITLVVGAGFSSDAGLPTWPKLVERVARGIVSDEGDELAEMAIADRDEPMRKAEYVLSMRKLSQGYGTTESIVREALYGDRATHRPGPQLRALAQLARALGDRVRILTTNFDNLLEIAFAEEGLATRAFMLDSVEDWPQHRDAAVAQGEIPVFYLHGRLRRSDPEDEDFVVLAESHFLRHGPLVRQVVVEQLRNSVTVFLGLSMTDPNLVGPLWDTQDDETRSYVVLSPTEVEGFSIEKSRAYSLKKNAYLEESLHVRTLFLKSYGQLRQLLFELRLAAAAPARYLADEREQQCIAYGVRLNRTLERAERMISQRRSEPGAESPESLLARSLQPQEALGALIEKFRRDDKTRARLARLVSEHASFVDDDEFLGIQLWLRDAAAGTVEKAQYGIHLVADTGLGFPHPHPPASRIELTSTNLAARALASSTGKVGVMAPDLSMGDMWHGSFATPLWIIDEVHVDDTVLTIPMAIGSLVLCSSNYIVNGREDVPKSPRISVLSEFSSDQRRQVARALNSVAQETLAALGL